MKDDKLLCLGCGMRDGEGHQPTCPIGLGLPWKFVVKPLDPPSGKIFCMSLRKGKDR